MKERAFINSNLAIIIFTDDHVIVATPAGASLSDLCRAKQLALDR